MHYSSFVLYSGFGGRWFDGLFGSTNSTFRLVGKTLSSYLWMGSGKRKGNIIILHIFGIRFSGAIWIYVCVFVFSTEMFIWNVCRFIQMWLASLENQQKKFEDSNFRFCAHICLCKMKTFTTNTRNKNVLHFLHLMSYKSHKHFGLVLI